MNRRIVLATTLIFGTIACEAKLNLPETAELTPRNSPVAVGEMAPDFTLEDQNNRKVSLSSTRGSMPTVLVFYRGNW